MPDKLPRSSHCRPLAVALLAGNRTAKELQSFVVATFPDIVSRISGSTVDTAFGSTMTHPKLVLFTDKEETPGLFRALAASFRKYKLLFFTIHSSDAEARKVFSVDKVGAPFTHAGSHAAPATIQGQFHYSCFRYMTLANTS